MKLIYSSLWSCVGSVLFYLDSLNFLLEPLDALQCFILVQITLLYHMQTACSGRFWFSSYSLKGSQPTSLLDYFFRRYQRTAVRIFLCGINGRSLCLFLHKLHVQGNCGSPFMTSSCGLKGRHKLLYLLILYFGYKYK